MTAARSSARWLEHGPRLLLGAFCFGILLVAAFYRGHSVESLDQRSYLQMIHAVATNGLPWWDNGPIDRFPQLVVFWGIPAQGRVWGIYGLLYPYLSAPMFRLGGLVLVSRATFATLAPLSVVSFLLARRVMKSEWLAVFAALSTVLSTPILAKALEITPYPLMALFATLGVYLTVRLVEAARPSPLLGVGCGLAWAAASSSHVLSLSMAVGGLAVLTIAPDPASGAIRPLLALRRVVPTIAGLALGLLPTALVNHIRFGTYSPVSYGYPPWSGPPNMTLGKQVAYSLPVTGFVFAVLGAALLLRKRRSLLLGVLGAAALVALLAAPLREKIARYALVGIGYFVAAGILDLGPPYVLAEDGVGRFLGGWIVKGALQGAPLLLLALVAARHAEERRWSVVAIIVPCVAQYVSLMLRANLINIDALGWPWVYPRYALAAYPGLVVASFVVVERTKPRVEHLVVAAVVATVLTVSFTVFTDDDHSLVKRLVILVVPLSLAVAALVVSLPREPRRFAPLVVAITAGFGIGMSLGHDLRANADAKIACDTTVNNFVRVMPRRFALLGPIGPMDVLLTTTVSHDVRYADVARLPFGWNRPLIDHWRSEARPVYLVSADPPASPWPDVSFERIPPMPDVYLVVFRDPAAP